MGIYIITLTNNDDGAKLKYSRVATDNGFNVSITGKLTPKRTARVPIKTDQQLIATSKSDMKLSVDNGQLDIESIYTMELNAKAEIEAMTWDRLILGGKKIIGFKGRPDG
jgi:hypothetical protein